MQGLAYTSDLRLPARAPVWSAPPAAGPLLTDRLPAAPLPLSQVGRLAGLEELDLYLTPTAPHQQFEFLPAALRGLGALRTLYILAPQSLSESLVIGPGLADLPALQVRAARGCSRSSVGWARAWSGRRRAGVRLPAQQPPS